MPVSLAIDVNELVKLRNYLLANDLKRARVTNPYELLHIQDGDIDINVYKSGKVVHNNSIASQEIISFILKKERNYDFLIGSDEVGKGEWYGPLVTSAVALTPEDILKFRKLGVKDSKQLKKDVLQKLAEEILRSNVVFKNIAIMPEKYNAKYQEFTKEGKSLNDLLAWAHVAAIKDVLERIPAKESKIKIIIDKFDAEKTDLRLTSAKIKQSNIEVIQSSTGDTEIPVSVASIAAKNQFEELVTDLEKKFGVNLRKGNPKSIDKKVLPFVAKTHFKNISGLLD
jgi:ribonuclease HIII